MRLLSYLFFLLSLFFSFSCTSSVPLPVYKPDNTAEVKHYFSKGIPIGVLVDDSLMMMCVMEPVYVSNIGYIRLWLLYGNKMSTEFLLSPLEYATLTVEYEDNTRVSVNPESPTKILADINDDAIFDSFMIALSGSIQALSTKNTKVKDNNGDELYSIEDKDMKSEYILQKSKNQLSNTLYYYSVLKESLNQGILRRNTVFSYQSINGFIYFPVAHSIGSYNKSSTFYNENEGNYSKITKYTFKFDTPVGIKTMVFRPIKGE